MAHLRHCRAVLGHHAAAVADAGDGDEQLRVAVHAGAHARHARGLRDAERLGRVVAAGGGLQSAEASVDIPRNCLVHTVGSTASLFGVGKPSQVRYTGPERLNSSGVSWAGNALPGCVA